MFTHRPCATCAFVFSVLFVSSLARAEDPTPQRLAPPPLHVGPGEAVVPQARAFAAVRAGDRALVAYIDNQTGGRGVLHTALLRANDPGGLTRLRPDVEIAAPVRALALTWDGTHGAIVYIVPRVLPGGFAHGPPPPQRRSTPLPPSVADPFGPSSASGGDVVLQRLDANGNSLGAPIPVFTENARLYRVAVASEGDLWTVAWTGATVTDDEVRGTIRAMRVRSTGPRRGAASATGWTGDTGDALRIVRTDDPTPRTVVLWTGARCASRSTLASPVPLATDPSARVENPTRRPLPQEPPTEVYGPPIACASVALHAAEFRPEDSFAQWTSTDALSTDALAVTPTYATTSLGGALVRFQLAPAADFGHVAPLFASQRPVPPAVLPPPPDTEPRERPADGVDPVLTEAPVPPPQAIPLSVGIRAPVALDAMGDSLAEVTTDHHTVAWVRPGASPSDPEVTALASTRGLWMDVAWLQDNTHPWVLARDGIWGGPVWLLSPDAPVVRPVPSDPPVDLGFARLWVRARTARGMFIRYENVAGALAARPEAPTDPRMPGVLASRARIQLRWQQVCGQLQARAQTLVRHGAPQDLLSSVRSVCQDEPDLRLGVPVDPNL